MLNAILIFFHIAACFTLILVILLQVGKGHGLSGASFNQGGVQTVFGTRAADFLSKATSVMAIVFMLTCISLDVLYARRSRSLFSSPGGGPATQVDMEKLKQVLEKIKAEQAAGGKMDPQAALTEALRQVSTPTEAAAPTAPSAATSEASPEQQPASQPAEPPKPSAAEPSEQAPAPAAQGG